ncbi:hypothetical protein Q73_02590 [Bacillus coahuilensis m2-6]|uniref:DUF6944 family repetitive protein n=1 Tax=Bacillus coahuilensis TaxID=408580 RepID=UPI00018514AD|nr:hypothetical protein [Bacillus coahuilensis]KUP09526.1 hypothetical protein Q73_02590 [Bacillus coahuilensis m2-6]
MDNHNLEQIAEFGAWTQAFGTIASAISSTPNLPLPEILLEDLNIIGNTLQATGNAVLVDTTVPADLSSVGNAVQSIGNSTVLVGLLLHYSETRKELLNIQGNLLQALGGGISVAFVYGQTPTEVQVLNLYGNLLQTIGNSIQSIAGFIELKRDEDTSELNAVGSWIQAVGSVLSAIGQSIDTRSNENEKNRDQ